MDLREEMIRHPHFAGEGHKTFALSRSHDAISTAILEHGFLASQKELQQANGHNNDEQDADTDEQFRHAPILTNGDMIVRFHKKAPAHTFES